MKEMSLYIHIPFCKQKCLYCDFPSYAGLEKFEDEYIEAINKEIMDKASDYLISSIFIGGGTPSYLSEKNLDSLLKTLKKLNLKEDAEFTVECNPGTLNENKLIIMKNHKVNRLSMGLQSTKNNLLEAVGRIHTFEEFKENYMLARKIGFKNINVDLMFGLPDQTLEDWTQSLEEIALLQPEHISAYSLIIEEGTCFYKLYEDNKLNLPSEDCERNMYLITKNILKNYGYHQYEISNFARDNKECSHNKVYWQCKEYLGLGASASSFIDENRIKNVDNIRDYINKINNNEDVSEEVYKNSIEDDMEEFVFMGLRMIEGISLDEFEERFKKNINDIYADVIEKNVKLELLVLNRGRLYLTSKGIELSNTVMSDFILTN